jgi:hypothetical protein
MVFAGARVMLRSHMDEHPLRVFGRDGVECLANSLAHRERLRPRGFGDDPSCASCFGVPLSVPSLAVSDFTRSSPSPQYG